MEALITPTNHLKHWDPNFSECFGDNGSLGRDPDADDSICFFRFKNLRDFDSSDEEANETLYTSEIDYLEGGPPRGWEEREVKKFVYIDDYNCVEKLRQRDSVFDLGTAGRVTKTHARKSEKVYNTLKNNADKIGMKVNHQKTQMLCMTNSKHQCKTHIITATGETIDSSGSLKILGYVFNSNPRPQAHIENILKKFRKRVWSIRYLKQAGLKEEDLLKVYVTFLRPVVEYAAPAFHSMMNKKQSSALERQQYRVLKIIYGFQHSSEKLLTMSGLPTLAERKEKLTENFARKLVASDSFKYLFPL